MTKTTRCLILTLALAVNAAGVAALHVAMVNGAEQVTDRRRRAAEALLQARHRGGEACGLHRLKQIVGRALLERGKRVLVVGRHEHDVAAAARLSGYLEA